MGIDPRADQRWGTYARSMLAFSGVSVLFLYLIERVQHWLPYANSNVNVPPALAWNTAASFVTNTNWQNYSGESTMGYVTQMAGLAVQNFVVGRRGHRRRHRADPRVHADQDRPARQLLGRPDPGRDPAAAAALGDRRASS